MEALKRALLFKGEFKMKDRVLDSEEEILQKIIEISSITDNSNEKILKGRYMQKLFFEYGIKDVIIDPVGNVIAKLPGEIDGNIVIFADLDDNKTVPVKTKVTMKDIIGTGVGINAFPLYSLAALAKAMKKSKQNHKTFYFICFTDGQTTYNGIKYFIKNFNENINGMVYLNGVEEGRLEKSTSSYINCDICFKDLDSNYLMEDNKNQLFYGMSKFILKIKEEEIGDIFNFKIEDMINSKELTGRYKVKLGISADIIDDAEKGYKILKDITEGVRAEENLIIEIKENYRRDGVISKEEKLYASFYEALKSREIKIYNISESSEISIPIKEGIETIYIGIGKGGNFGKESEYIEIKSIYRGIELVYEALLNYEIDF
jgi:acetylornithine deacetylase/succinyl-diaminopimelate desuccinylase-like protein